METLAPAVMAGLFASGLYLLVGQLAGLWKYMHIRRDPKRGAPRYVNVAHQAALMYSFAALVIAALAYVSAWSDCVNFIAALAPLVFFGLAIEGYLIHGYLQDTNNQLDKPHVFGKKFIPAPVMTAFMFALTLAEIGGVAVLFVGALKGFGWF